jgi:hypothetical protein
MSSRSQKLLGLRTTVLSLFKVVRQREIEESYASKYSFLFYGEKHKWKI